MRQGARCFLQNKGTTVLRGATGQHHSRHSCQDPNPKTSQCRGPPRRGAGRRTLSEHGQRSRVHIVSTVLSSTECWAQGCSQQARQILTDCRVTSQRGHEWDGAKPLAAEIQGGGGPEPFTVTSAFLPSGHLSVVHPSAASTTARHGAGPRGQPHPVERQVVIERERDMGVDCRDARKREGGRCCQEELHWR